MALSFQRYSNLLKLIFGKLGMDENGTFWICGLHLFS